MKYYLDSSIVIYLVEKISDYRNKVIDLLPEDIELIVSDLTRMECRIKPIQNKNELLLEEYDLFFQDSVDIISLTKEILDKATIIRAEYFFKTPDSIHLATAIVSNADAFITNDKRSNSFKEVKIIQI